MRFKWLKIIKGSAGFNESLDHGFYITDYTIRVISVNVENLSELSQWYKIELKNYIRDLTFRETAINDAILFSE